MVTHHFFSAHIVGFRANVCCTSRGQISCCLSQPVQRGHICCCTINTAANANKICPSKFSLRNFVSHCVDITRARKVDKHDPLFQNLPWAPNLCTLHQWPELAGLMARLILHEPLLQQTRNALLTGAMELEPLIYFGRQVLELSPELFSRLPAFRKGLRTIACFKPVMSLTRCLSVLIRGWLDGRDALCHGCLQMQIFLLRFPLCSFRLHLRAGCFSHTCKSASLDFVLLLLPPPFLCLLPDEVPVIKQILCVHVASINELFAAEHFKHHLVARCSAWCNINCFIWTWPIAKLDRGRRDCCTFTSAGQNIWFTQKHIDQFALPCATGANEKDSPFTLQGIPANCDISKIPLPSGEQWDVNLQFRTRTDTLHDTVRSGHKLVKARCNNQPR
mmetsp:Transcript_95437/g.179533  ORF Transcript_95437/g.179533 Transcript_95437/m.179533 type:complete len:390 (-) Transcript_95437:466-1635(-)